MRRLAVLTCALAVVAVVARPVAQTTQPAPQRNPKNLEIYIADTEGGKATLFVTPSGQAVMIDSGNPGERDLTRILAILADAGVTKLDYLISSHYHVDHVGGLAELAKRIPIAHFIDHGPNVEAKEQVQGFQATYAELYAVAKHTVVKPGDKVPLTGVDWTVVTSAGAALKKPLPGGGRPNPVCAQVQKKEDPPNPDDNAQSVGSVIAFGQFRAIDLGDLLWNKEVELMCPNNPVGTVDLYLVTHHGLAQSGSDALVHGVRPRVAVMQNGTRKGGAVAAYEIMEKSPGLEDIWQLHWSYNAGIEHNPAGVFIANVDDAATIAGVLTAPPGGRGGGRGGPAPGAGGPAAGSVPAATTPAGVPPAGTPDAPAPTAAQPTTPGAAAPPQGSQPMAGQPPGGAGPAGGRGNPAAAHSPAYYIKISAQTDGTFTVTNTRNGYSKTYVKRGT
jgi:beta-lactamase superfamily II metal-dependent hydrolase